MYFEMYIYIQICILIDTYIYIVIIDTCDIYIEITMIKLSIIIKRWVTRIEFEISFFEIIILLDQSKSLENCMNEL